MYYICKYICMYHTYIIYYPFLFSAPFIGLIIFTISISFTSTMSASDQLKMVRLEIKGVVQGVSYRDWTVENASKLGLNGWVRNRKDGSVEAVFAGSVDNVDDMEQRCRRGPNGAIVTSLDSFPFYEDPGSGFQRKPTA